MCPVEYENSSFSCVFSWDFTGLDKWNLGEFLYQVHHLLLHHCGAFGTQMGCYNVQSYNVFHEHLKITARSVFGEFTMLKMADSDLGGTGGCGESRVVHGRKQKPFDLSSPAVSGETPAVCAAATLLGMAGLWVRILVLRWPPTNRFTPATEPTSADVNAGHKSAPLIRRKPA